MLDFMVIALPRSGTTWASNWLTTADSLCVHDPLYTTPYRRWDVDLGDGRPTGVACTGVFHFPAWLNAHPARKVVLHRPLAEIDRSMRRLGSRGPTPAAAALLDQLEGLHVPWTDLFEPASALVIAEHLGLAFDAVRHEQLRQMEVQPRFRSLAVDPYAASSALMEIQHKIARL